MSDESKNQNENEEVIDYGSFLTTSAEDVQTEEFVDTSSDPDYYRPTITHKEAKNREYKGRGRFVPNVLNRDMQKISKYIFCLPVIGEEKAKFYVDVPEGEGAKKNIVTQAFFALREHESVVYQQIAKEHFSRKMYHWMLWLTMSDVQEPEAVGTIKIFRFGKKINDKIEYEAKIDASVGKKTEIAVHDPFNGKDLVLHINEITNDKGTKMTNYDQSQFDALSAISLDGGETRMTNSPDDMKTIFEFLKSKSPDLSKAAHKPWTEEEEEKIIKTVQSLVDDDVLFNQIYKKAYGRNFFTNPISTNSASTQQQKVAKKEEVNDTVEFASEEEVVSTIKEDAKKSGNIKEESASATIKEDKNLESIKANVIKEEESAKETGGDTGAADAMTIDVDFEEEN